MFLIEPVLLLIYLIWAHNKTFTQLYSIEEIVCDILNVIVMQFNKNKQTKCLNEYK